MTFRNAVVFPVSCIVTDVLGLADLITSATMQITGQAASGPSSLLARSGCKVWVDSEQTSGENGRGANTID